MTVVLVVAVLAGYPRGGRIGNLANLHLRGLALLLAAVCAPFAAGWLGGPDAATTGTALALLLVAGFLGGQRTGRHGGCGRRWSCWPSAGR